MENKLQLFENEEFGKVRVVEIDGQPWFVGKDVAEALGYSDTFGALKKHVDNEDRQNCQNDSFESNRGLTVINESGLYSLILSSKLPTAKAFKRWVTSEILPSIRKHGAYIAPEVLERLAGNQARTDTLVQALANEQDLTDYLLRELEGEEAYSEHLEDKIAEIAPKAAYFDQIIQSPGALQVSLIAKDYGMSAASFNKLLHAMGIQYKMGETWVLYQKYAGQGYTRSKTYYVNAYTTVVHTYWTQKGRLFLYDTLGEYGILPLEERTAGAVSPSGSSQ